MSFICQKLSVCINPTKARKVKKILVFGATELARLAYYYATESGMDVLGFAIDESYKIDDESLPAPVFCWPEAMNKFFPNEVGVFVAVGYKEMRLREAIYARIKSVGYELINIVSDSSWVAKDVSMRDNNFIMPGVVVEPGVKLGCNNVIWSNATICHDTTIGSHNFIAANVTLGGSVSIGDRNFIGFSSVVLQRKNVQHDALIAANSLVTHDLDSLSEYRGSPARRHGAIDPQTGVLVR